MKQTSLKDLKHLVEVDKIWNVKIFTHSENLDVLKENFNPNVKDDCSFSAKPIPIHVDDNLAKIVNDWKMPEPANPFYIYTEEDKAWASKIHYGEPIEDAVFYVFQKPGYYGHRPKGKI